MAPFGHAQLPAACCAPAECELAGRPSRSAAAAPPGDEAPQHGVTFRAVAFGGADWAEELAAAAAYRRRLPPGDQHASAAGHNVELHLVDWRQARDAVRSGVLLWRRRFGLPGARCSAASSAGAGFPTPACSTPWAACPASGFCRAGPRRGLRRPGPGDRLRPDDQPALYRRPDDPVAGAYGAQRVLEIGTGSGYQTAVLAELAREVVSIERHEPLRRRPRPCWRSWATATSRLVVGDGTEKRTARRPFDRILVAAAALKCPPRTRGAAWQGGNPGHPAGPARLPNARIDPQDRRPGPHEPLSRCRFVPWWARRT